MRPAGFAALFAIFVVAAPATQSIPQDTGASGAWQKLLKVRTTASVMHVTAHPDDEHGGVLARLSRGDGARLALFTLTRGESGDNAIGPQLFDALGLIRTDELLNAGRYYGVDEQYFATVVDYGFSKRLDETVEKWGRDNVLRDAVRVIRTSRPWIVLSRFQGNQRDGHGNHQAAGLVAAEASKAAGDPSAFPEQIAEGLRPWQPFKVYMGGVRVDEDWTVRVDSGEYSPWLGESYDNVARYGLSFQRSQNGGRFVPGAGPNFGYYTRTDARATKAAKEPTVFDGLNTTYAGLFSTIGRPIPSAVRSQLAAIDQAVARAMGTFTLTDPSLAVPALVEGLKLTRDVIAAVPDEAEVLFVLRIKERQFQDAVNGALGLDLVATAEPSGPAAAAGRGGARGGSPPMAAPVPGQEFVVSVRLANRGGVPIQLAPQSGAGPGLEIRTARGWTATSQNPVNILANTPMPAPGVSRGAPGTLNRHEVATARFEIAVSPDAPLSTRPYFSRPDLSVSRYTLSDPAAFGGASSPAPLVVVARYTIGGVPIEIADIVRRRELRLPYGEVLREVRSVPRLAVTMTPSAAIVPLSAATKRVEVEVLVLHNAEAQTSGRVTLGLPPGWTAQPADHPFSFARAGERASYRFAIRPGTIDPKSYRIEAVASASGQEYRDGYDLIDHRDLEVRYLYRAASADVRGVNVTTLPGLKVGYVMGIGDQVPMGLQQLGAEVTLLGERELATANLSAYDTIFTGTRAYAVREDLKTYNQRLLDYVKAGGNMVVLYNTQEFVPSRFAPFGGELPGNAEEVSEEDSPVTILAPAAQSFTWPNQITLADFEGWVEQRGSKFFTKWDAAYTPMIATFDKGQAPQQGGWLTARHGKGTWTYFAYALHRQFPYGVPGAYRIAANLLALGKAPKAR